MNLGILCIENVAKSNENKRREEKEIKFNQKRCQTGTKDI